MPKSSSLTWPPVSTRTFDGLKSRWTTRLRCACGTATMTSRNSPRRALTPSSRSVA